MEGARLARDEANRRVDELRHRRDQKLAQLDHLRAVRPGAVRYVGSAIVEPTDLGGTADLHRDPEVEAAAMRVVMDYERNNAWEPEDVSQLHDGSGFDIRSLGPTDAAGKRMLRRIEVKGRAVADVDVELTPNEWVQARRHGDSYWLYVVWNAKTDPQLLRIQNPAARLRDQVAELRVVKGYRVPAAAISQEAQS
jgi:hypothetical protein